MMGLYRYANGGSTIAPSMGYPSPPPTSGQYAPPVPYPNATPGGTLGYTGQGIGSYSQQPPAYSAQPQQQGGFNPGAYPAFSNPQFGQPMPQQMPQPMPGQYARGGLVDAAEKLQSAGRYGDTDLVHVNGVEREMMRGMFGPETINPETGLPEHFAFLPALLAGGKALLGSKLGAALVSTAAGTLLSKAGSKGGNVPPVPQVPLTVRPLNREATPIPADFDPFSYGQRGGEFSFFRNKTEAAPSPGAMQPGVVNGPSYMTHYPDVAQEYQKLLGDKKGRAELSKLGIGNADQFAQWHYGKYGSTDSERRTPYREGGDVDYDDDDSVAHLMAYAEGGGHEGPGQVRGIGSGQDDKIPAWLSDGEYVWSAQDVADLGDGSTDEGVRRLDDMRQLVRKQAGRRDVKKIAKPQRGIDHMLKAVGGGV